MSGPGTASPLRVIAVGQTPPPYGGQAAAIASFVTGSYTSIEVTHVRMAFSSQISDIGRVQLSKLWHLAALIVRILWGRGRTGARVLYYPPAGPDLAPVVRDIVLLLCTRWAFHATVFHFHAAGVSEFEHRLPRLLRPAFRAAYGGAELAIQCSALNPPDGRRLGARRTVVVDDGVPDHPLAASADRSGHDGPPVILYVGVLTETKGLLVLVDACRRLRERGLDFRLHLMGAFDSEGFESALRSAIAAAGLGDWTVLLGTQTGDAKASSFLAADVFCFPTFFNAESFGIVSVEAMQFGLPVVATRWRGVPSIVADGDTGLLVDVRDPAGLADALARLIADPALRARMGARGRERYLQRFTEDRYRRSMQAVIGEL